MGSSEGTAVFERLLVSEESDNILGKCEVIMDAPSSEIKSARSPDFDHIKQLLDIDKSYSAKILSDSKIYFSFSEILYIGSSITGLTLIPLGFYFENLWREDYRTPWLRECPDCENKIKILSKSGAMSMGSYYGYCSECCDFKSGHMGNVTGESVYLRKKLIELYEEKGSLSIDDFREMDRVATGGQERKLNVMIEILGGNCLSDIVRVINTE